MKQYVIKDEPQDIVAPKNLEEVIERVVDLETRRAVARKLYRKSDFKLAELDERLHRVENLIQTLKEIFYDGSKSNNEKETDI